MDIKNETTEDLRETIFEIQKELNKRKLEPMKICYVLKLNNSLSGATYFKNFDEAFAEYSTDVYFSVVETHNKLSLESAEIPESDYNIRPARWYS